MSKRTIGSLYLALAASIWGSMYVVSKVVLMSVPPLALIWLRYMVGLIGLAGMATVSRQSWRVSRRDIPLILAVGIIGYVLSIWAQFLGTQWSSAAMGAVITSATPAFMVIFARWLLGEQITWRKTLALLLATGGVLLIVGVGHIHGRFQVGGFILGLAALAWALMSVLVKRIPGHYSQLVVTTYAIVVATAVLTPTAMVQLSTINGTVYEQPQIWGGVLYLGLVSTAGAFFLWNKGLQMVDAASGSLYFFFQPLVGASLAWLFLGEHGGVTFLVGTALILVGVLFTVLTRTKSRLSDKTG